MVDTPLGALRGRATSAVAANERCVLAVRPENVAIDGAAENAVDGKVVLTSYLGSVLRYDVATAAGLVLKVDIRDPWHHVPLAAGQTVRLTFPSSAAVTLLDE